MAVVVTPTVPTPMTWNPSSSWLLKYGLVKLTSLNSSKSNICLGFPADITDKVESDTANPTLYPRVNDIGGLIREIVWPDPTDVNEIQSGINFLDLN